VIVAVLPALDEEETISDVVRGLLPRVDRVVVVDNGSRDRTAQRARDAGAEVALEPRRGYGHACLAGIARASELGASVLVLLDADGSDDPNELPRLLAPLVEGDADLVLGCRQRGTIEPGAMTPAQRFGNWLAPRLMRLAVGARYRDMPPFKVMTREAFERLGVTDTGHGFTIELLLKAHARGLVTREVSVRCRRRAGGKSKVSGTVLGTARASLKIVTTIARHALALRMERETA
jgi:glycosyltransferase involved in cell wall biosynthesis